MSVCVCLRVRETSMYFVYEKEHLECEIPECVCDTLECERNPCL